LLGEGAADPDATQGVTRELLERHGFT
jgi:hypothetical protein